MRLSGVSAAPRRDRCGSAPRAHGKSGAAAPSARHWQQHGSPLQSQACHERLRLARVCPL
eukprot:6432940-Prymnesium_polylepis.1